jgi:hypothetical protein
MLSRSFIEKNGSNCHQKEAAAEHARCKENFEKEGSEGGSKRIKVVDTITSFR